MIINAQAAGPDNIRIRAAGRVEITAEDATGKPARFSMVGYTGAAMRLEGFFNPVVVDLRGLSVASQTLPVLRQHNPEKVVGHTDEIKIGSSNLTAFGVISGAGSDAVEVCQTASNGFPWQASIGASIQRREFVEAGSTVNVNGQQFTGPLIVARATTLKEISIVALGADDKTKVAVKAKGVTVEFAQFCESKGFDINTISAAQRASLESWFAREHAAKPAGVTLADAETLAAEYVQTSPDFASAARNVVVKAVESGWDKDKTQLELMKAHTIHCTGNVVAGPGAPPRPGQTHDLLCASILMSHGVEPKRIAGFYGDRTTDAATQKQFRNLSLHGLMRLVIQCAGRHAPPGRFTDTDIRDVMELDASLRSRRPEIHASTGPSTVTLSGILGDSISKMMLMSFDAVGTAWQRFCRVGADLTNFHAAKRYRLTAKGTFQEIPLGGELKHLSLEESEFDAQLATYGAIIALDRKQLINDDLSAFATLPKIIGRQGAIKLERSVFELLLSNPSSFFGVGNANLSTGAGSALALAGLTTAEKLFNEQTDSNADPLLIPPQVLLVPPALQATARSLTASQSIVLAGDTDTEKPDGNVFAGRFDPVVSPYLGTALGLTGSSDAAWYLLAGPGDYAVMEVCFLNGQRAPLVQEAEMDFNRLGMQWRGIFDWSVGLLEYRGGVKSNGS